MVYAGAGSADAEARELAWWREVVGSVFGDAASDPGTLCIRVWLVGAIIEQQEQSLWTEDRLDLSHVTDHTPYTLQLEPNSLHHTPYTKPYILNLDPQPSPPHPTLNTTPQTPPTPHPYPDPHPLNPHHLNPNS